MYMKVIVTFHFAAIFSSFAISEFESESWTTDFEFAQVAYNGCDFPVFSKENISQANNNEPYIIRNSISHWPAFKKWKKSELLKFYGHRVVRSGSESSIVHSGGVAENQSTLKDMIDTMSASDVPALGRAFIFDTTILQVIPELNEDFYVPDLFHSWDNTVNESRALVWHMLSLGPSKSGLPFHNHGQTWLAVVHGIKQWFIYPPGYDPPSHIDAAYSPMNSVLHWVDRVLPYLRIYPKPPLFSSVPGIDSMATVNQHGEASSSVVEGYRPLECQQYPGDILYLPARWTHLTINIGETIAIGGQEALHDNIRYKEAVKVLKTRPHNYDAWKDLGLAQFNIALGKHQHLRNLAGLQEPGGIIYLSGVEQVDQLLAETRDSFLVLYYDSSNRAVLLNNASESECVEKEKRFQKLRTVWAELAVELQNIVNVALCDLHGNFTSQRALPYLLELDRLDIEKDRSAMRWTELNEDITMYKVDPLHLFLSLPMAKLHRGDCSSCSHISKMPHLSDSAPNITSVFSTDAEVDYARKLNKKIETAENAEFMPDISGLVFEGDIKDSAGVAQLLHEEMRVSRLAPGSISSTSVSLRRDFKQAYQTLMRALEIKPLQPELRNIMGEAASLAHDFDAMKAVLGKNTDIVDNLAEKGLASLSLASMYHKIGHCFIKAGMGSDALLPIQKALREVPTFRPALIDHVFTHFLLGDRGAAEYALEQLRLTLRNANLVWETDPDALRLEQQVRALAW